MKKKGNQLKKKRFPWLQILQAFSDVSIDGICINDDEGRFLYVNDALSGQTGYSREELLTMTISDLETIETTAETHEHLQQIIRNGVTRFETIHKHKDGSLFNVEVNSTFVDLKGQRTFLAFHRDITKKKETEEELRKHHDYLEEMVKDRTSEVLQANEALTKENEERRRIEKALRASEEKLSSFMDAATDGFILSDHELNVIQINNAALSVMGAKKDDIIGRNLRELPQLETIGLSRDDLPNSKQKNMCEEYIKVIKTGEPFFADIVYSADPNIRGMNLWVSAFKVGSGLGIIVTDITERVEARQELQRLNKELERRVEEQTVELKNTQEQLLRHERLTTLGNLTAGLAHELRHPLGAIQNATYLLNMLLEQPHPEVKETLEILNKEVASSERIINSLVDFVRPHPIIKHKCNINDITKSALSKSLIPKNIEVIDHLDEMAPCTMLDADKIERAFMNIILNAIQAMPNGGQLVIRSETLNHDWLAISFADTGAGIPAENLEKIFEPLFTTKSKGSGIGLGLTIAKTMVVGHGGTIDVKSTVCKGSTFTIRLPLQRTLEK
jgi:PAS domain S-box-containing protein